MLSVLRIRARTHILPHTHSHHRRRRTPSRNPTRSRSGCQAPPFHENPFDPRVSLSVTQILACLGVGLHKKWFLNVPEPSAFPFLLCIAFFFCFLFFFLLVPWERAGTWGSQKKGIRDGWEKKKNGTGMHIDTSPASLPPFPFLVLIFLPCYSFRQLVCPPPPTHSLPAYWSCFLPNVCTHSFKDLTNAMEEPTGNVSGRAGSGLAPEESER